ncbi:MAG: hypothetical protein WDW36_007041 [Sanguina aurantia]
MIAASSSLTTTRYHATDHQLQQQQQQQHYFQHQPPQQQQQQQQPSQTHQHQIQQDQHQQYQQPQQTQQQHQQFQDPPPFQCDVPGPPPARSETETPPISSPPHGRSPSALGHLPPPISSTSPDSSVHQQRRTTSSEAANTLLNPFIRSSSSSVASGSGSLSASLKQQRRDARQGFTGEGAAVQPPGSGIGVQNPAGNVRNDDADATLLRVQADRAAPAAQQAAALAETGGRMGSQLPPGFDPITGPALLYKQALPPNMLAVTIQGSDPLRLDRLVTSPVVRLHVLDAKDGSYLSNLATSGLQLGPDMQAQMLAFPGRGAQVTIANGAGQPQPALQEYLPPVQTAPYDMAARPEGRAQALWDETLQVDEALERLVELDALLVFEVLQMPASFRRYHKHPRGYDQGVHLLAWGFLRLRGPFGPLTGSMKLQLYEYRTGLSRAVRAAAQSSAQSPVRAYVAWQALMAAGGPAVVARYPSALAVHLEAVPRPDARVVVTQPSQGIRPILPAGYGSGFETSAAPLEAWLARAGPGGLAGGVGGDRGGEGGPSAEEALRALHQRHVTDPCKIPNVVMRKLPGGSGGVSTIAFSGTGTYLALACCMPNDVCQIVLYHTLTGSRVLTIASAHHTLIYSLAWSKDDSCLVSASSDCTAKVWDVGHSGGDAALLQPVVLRHACYCYTAEFHPNQRQHPLIATGAYDGAVRLWATASGQMVAQVQAQGGTINSLAFDFVGSALYTGDAQGVLREYALDLRGVGQGGGSAPIRALRSCTDMEGEPISHLMLQPGGRKLSVLTKSSRLLLVDLKSFNTGNQFQGPVCRSAPLKANCSPDGAFLVSGSEDGAVWIWDAGGGCPPSRLRHFEVGGDVTSTVVWNPAFNIAAVCSFSAWAPVLLMSHDPRRADVAVAVGAKSVPGPMGHAQHKNPITRSYNLPERLTPDIVHAMLEKVRADARARRLMATHPDSDPHGQQLNILSQSGGGEHQEDTRGSGSGRGPANRQAGLSNAARQQRSPENQQQEHHTHGEGSADAGHAGAHSHSQSHQEGAPSHPQQLPAPTSPLRHVPHDAPLTPEQLHQHDQDQEQQHGSPPSLPTHREGRPQSSFQGGLSARMPPQSRLTPASSAEVDSGPHLMSKRLPAGQVPASPDPSTEYESPEYESPEYLPLPPKVPPPSPPPPHPSTPTSFSSSSSFQGP